MKTITILSGKGGVGKSSITASLAVILAKKYKIVAADCDVDASNLALVLGKKSFEFAYWGNISTNKKAVFDLAKCISCGKCLETCYFNAIEWENSKPKLRDFSCEGCGACELVCPEGAIKLVDSVNAKIGDVITDYGFQVVSAQLIAGESGSGKLVNEVKNRAKSITEIENTDFLLIDAAAGIGCPVIASVSGSDYCILVVEPTEASLFDLQRAFEIVQHFEILGGIVINKFDINKEFCTKIELFAKINNLNILIRLPYDKCFTEALVEMIPVVENNSEIRVLFNDLAKKMEKI